MNYFLITKNKPDANGLWLLNLDAYVGGKRIDRMQIQSGLRGAQHFRTFPTQKVGAYEPIPEGEYENGPLLWASGVHGDYSKRYPNIDSPIWMEIVHSRSIGFHLDGNRSYAPGSAGCPVFLTEDDMKKFVGWLEGNGRFEKTYVDYGLGHVKLPKAQPDPPVEKPPKPKPEPKINAPGTFSDVPENSWAYEAIEGAYEKGLLSGYPSQSGEDPRFYPDQSVSRKELAAALLKTLSVANGIEVHPQDESSMPMYPYALALHQAGILNTLYSINGRPSFGLDRHMTMEQILSLVFSLIVNQEKLTEIIKAVKEQASG